MLPTCCKNSRRVPLILPPVPDGSSAILPRHAALDQSRRARPCSAAQAWIAPLRPGVSAATACCRCPSPTLPRKREREQRRRCAGDDELLSAFALASNAVPDVV